MQRPIVPGTSIVPGKQLLTAIAPLVNQRNNHIVASGGKCLGDAPFLPEWSTLSLLRESQYKFCCACKHFWKLRPVIRRPMRSLAQTACAQNQQWIMACSWNDLGIIQDQFLLAVYSNYGPLLYRFRDKVRRGEGVCLSVAHWYWLKTKLTNG